MRTPSGVRLYSTRGGMVAWTSRRTNPSRSSACSVCDSIFSLTPSTLRRSALNRYSPWVNAARARTPHLLVTVSIVRREGHARAKTSAARASAGSADAAVVGIERFMVPTVAIQGAIPINRTNQDNCTYK